MPILILLLPGLLRVLRIVLQEQNSLSLCETCTFACITRARGIRRTIVVCTATNPNRRIRFNVRDCSRFTDKRSVVVDFDIANAPALAASKRRVGFSIPEPAGTTTREPTNVTVDNHE